MLWEGSLVMVDSETESLWSHILGEAMRGPLEGEVLEIIPSVMTDWGTWKSRYPQSTVVVMPRTAVDYTRSFLSQNTPLIIGIADENQARAWWLADLDSNPVLNDRFAEWDVLVAYDKRSMTAVLFDRDLDGRELSFEERDGKLVDRETGSEWDRLTGVATQGPLKGKRLSQLPGIVSDAAAWHTYHFETTFWELKRE